MEVSWHRALQAMFPAADCWQKVGLDLCLAETETTFAVWKWTRQWFPNIVKLSPWSTLKWKVWETSGGRGVVATQCVHSSLGWSVTSFLLFFSTVWIYEWSWMKHLQQQWGEWISGHTHTCTHTQVFWTYKQTLSWCDVMFSTVSSGAASCSFSAGINRNFIRIKAPYVSVSDQDYNIDWNTIIYCVSVTGSNKYCSYRMQTHSSQESDGLAAPPTLTCQGRKLIELCILDCWGPAIVFAGWL